MDLSDTCSRKRVQIDLFELALPLRSISLFKDAHDLLDRHDISRGPCLLHSIAKNGW